MRPRFMLFPMVFKIAKEVIIIFESFQLLSNSFLHLLILELHAILGLGTTIRLIAPVLVGILVLEFSTVGGVSEEETVILLSHLWIRDDGISLRNLLE